MIEKLFNIDEYINSQKQRLIEVFVMFYGEEERETITTKFMNTPFIGYLTRIDYLSLLFDAQKEVSKIAEDYFFKKVGIENPSEIRKHLFSSWGYGEMHNYLDTFYEYYFDERNRKFALTSLSRIVGKDSLSWDDPKLNEYIEYALSLKEAYYEGKKIYDTLMAEKYENNQKQLEELRKLELNARNEVLVEYNKYIAERLSKENTEWSKLRLDQLVGKSFEYYSPIDFFTSEQEEKMNNPETKKETVDYIKSNRIKYFKEVTGLQFDTYEEYINNPEVKKYIPPLEFADEFKMKKDEFKIKFEKKVVHSFSYNQDIIKRIESKKYTNKNDMLTNIMINKTTCLDLFFEERDGEVYLSPLIFINGKADADSFDCRLIHECNHLYESTLTSVKDRTAEVTVGWDISNENIDEESKVKIGRGARRKYELFNEIINELIAQDITKIMHENNEYFIGDEKTAGNTSQSGYQATAVLVINFYKYFKDDIIESRKFGNMGHIFEIVGKENFEELNLIINEFFEFMNDYQYKVYNSIQNGEDNELTRTYYSYVQKSKEIFEKMQSYSLNKSL